MTEAELKEFNRLTDRIECALIEASRLYDARAAGTIIAHTKAPGHELMDPHTVPCFGINGDPSKQDTICGISANGNNRARIPVGFLLDGVRGEAVAALFDERLKSTQDLLEKRAAGVTRQELATLRLLLNKYGVPADLFKTDGEES